MMLNGAKKILSAETERKMYTNRRTLRVGTLSLVNKWNISKDK